MTCQLEGTRLHLNPEADVADLFESFNKQFFWDKLKYVEVRWSPRMTLCAGLCVYHRRPGYCSIRLSRPLLSLRGKSDLVETLLHEMIHAFLFVTENNKDRDGHGPEFLKHMDRINREAGLKISVYHSFKDEVRHYQKHVWLCSGPCKFREPYYGKVCRAMNRNPCPTDYWWTDHERSCGGIFSKISEPEGFVSDMKSSANRKKESPVRGNKDIRSFFKAIHEKVPVKAVRNHVNSPIKGSREDKSNATDRNQTVRDLETNYGNEREIPGPSTQDSTTKSCEDDYSAPENSAGDEGVLGILGSIFSLPLQFLKRRSKNPDPSAAKVRKPNFSEQPKSKRGTLRHLIKVPDQPTLDIFYKKKKFCGDNRKRAAVCSQVKKTSLKQPTVNSFFDEQTSN